MYRRILVPIDGSATALRGLEEAIKLARSSGAELRLLHVVNEFVMDAGYVPALYHDRLIESFREAGRRAVADAEAIVRQHGVQFSSSLLEVIGGRVSDLIVQEAKQWPADLIAMGTHGRRGLSRVALGSDAELVLRYSPVPVLLVRSAPDKS